MTVQQLKTEIAGILDKAFFKFQQDLGTRFPEGNETVSARDVMKLTSKLRQHITNGFSTQSDDPDYTIPPVDVK